MAEEVIVRPAQVADAEDISRLIHSQLHHRSPESTGPAPESFTAQFAPRALETCIAAENCNYLVALADDRLIAVLGIRDNRRLVHLFVADGFQRRGVARRLWERAKADVLATVSEAEISVRSSIHAVPVYLRLGFEVCGPRMDSEVVSWVPLRRVLRRGKN